jgi:hypothetical protein
MPGPLPTLPRKRERESAVPRDYSVRIIGAFHLAPWDRLLRPLSRSLAGEGGEGAGNRGYSTWAPEVFTTAAHFGISLLM